MLARHVSDLTSPSSGAFYKLYLQIWYVVMRVLLDTSSRHFVTAEIPTMSFFRSKSHIVHFTTKMLTTKVTRSYGTVISAILLFAVQHTSFHPQPDVKCSFCHLFVIPHRRLCISVLRPILLHASSCRGWFGRINSWSTWFCALTWLIFPLLLFNAALSVAVSGLPAT